MVDKKIREALLKLLTKKSVTDISVSELARKAKVSRASFYRKYGCIDDVAEDISDRLLNLMIDEYPVLLSNDRGEKCREAIFNYFEDQAKKDITAVLLPENDNYIRNKVIVKLMKIASESPQKEIDEIYDTYVKIGIIANFVKIWNTGNRKKSTREIADLAYRYVKKI